MSARVTECGLQPGMCACTPPESPTPQPPHDSPDVGGAPVKEVITPQAEVGVSASGGGGRLKRSGWHQPGRRSEVRLETRPGGRGAQVLERPRRRLRGASEGALRRRPVTLEMR
jgi:hypothetical protein